MKRKIWTACLSFIFLIVDITVYVILKLINVLFVPGISVLLDDAKVKSNITNSCEGEALHCSHFLFKKKLICSDMLISLPNQLQFVFRQFVSAFGKKNTLNIHK